MRKRDAPLLQVFQDGLSENRFRGGVVEQVVDQLKGHSQRAAVPLDLLFQLGADLSQHAAQPAATAKQVGCFAVTDL